MAQTFAELGRVEAIKQLFEGTPYEPFGEPLWFQPEAGASSVNASRLFLEGMDFNLMYFPLKHLGYKCVVELCGELHAVMAMPRALSVVLGVSSKLDFEQVSELWSGIVSAAQEFGYKSLSLDLQPSANGLCISVSAVGADSGKSCALRPAPMSKDLICVSGSLGAAYLGLQLLEKERENFEKGISHRETLEQRKMLVASYLKPELAPNTPIKLEDEGIIPSMGYFVTRGLSDAILRLVRDSGLGAKVYADKIPFEGGSFSLGKELNVDPFSAAMNGGDDCRLLYTVPILKLEEFRRNFQTFDIIGHLAIPDVGAVLVTPEGVELPITAQGWTTV